MPKTTAAMFALRWLTILGLGLAIPWVPAAAKTPTAAEGVDFFESRIRPVLVEHCYACHSAEATTVEGGLRLDSRDGLWAGGENGAVLVAAEPEKSRLFSAISYTADDLQMPPAGPLPATIVDDFRRWIAMGAPTPRGGQPTIRRDTILERARRHWAFVPPQDRDAPAISEAAWTRQPLDRFVLAAFERQRAHPAPEATPAVLLRRVHYVLTGLPPRQDEVRQFVADPADAVYEKLVDQLLASPHYGERLARHWLDIARYGDTKGYVFEEDRNYPHAYKFRDWVIAAFNRDLPYDRFLALQIAADQLVGAAEREDLAAQGYVTLGRRFINNQHDIIDDRVDVVFRGMMGLTVSCARCHDHKYDPISTRDYYGLYGIFASSEEQQDDDLPLRLVDAANPKDVTVFRRGNAHDRGPLAPRRFPLFFAEMSSSAFDAGSGRLALAESIASRDNPLTARVFVNRVWAHVFGEPLVGTMSDFGLRSDPPSNQALLDHLAVTFMEDGWSVKRLLRRLVTSSAFRQSSRTVHTTVVRRRLDFEAMRDSLLVAAGRLDETVGGPSFAIEASPATVRRTLYAHIDRQNLPAQFRTFDFANPDNHSPQRRYTTVPQQSLFLMNSPFVQEMAARSAVRIDRSHPLSEQIHDIYGLVYGRDATPQEVDWGYAFLGRDAAEQTLAASPWEYGYGSVDDLSRVSFTRLPYFTGTQWQEAADLPGANLGWVMLNDNGGHPGNDLRHAAIRRWTAPVAGPLVIRGQLHHPSERGDGVRGRVISDRRGLLGQWEVAHADAVTRLEIDDVELGEIIDFVVDCREHEDHDSFRWDAAITLSATGDGEQHHTWDTRDGFHGPQTPMTRWEQYVQVLLMSNEFHFLD